MHSAHENGGTSFIFTFSRFLVGRFSATRFLSVFVDEAVFFQPSGGGFAHFGGVEDFVTMFASFWFSVGVLPTPLSRAGAVVKIAFSL